MRKRLRIVGLGTLAGFSLLVTALSMTAGCIRSEESIQVKGMTRHYRMHAPKDIADRGAVPLVLALHQFSDTDKGMQNLTDFDALADAEGFVVVYPQGRWRVWNVWGKDSPDDVAFLNALIDSVSARYKIDPDRIYATGASAGGMMTQYFACMSDRLAAIAPVMGSIGTDWAATWPVQPPIPVLIMHGTKDPVIPFNGGDTNAGPGQKVTFLSARDNAAFWAKRNGCGDTPTEETLPDADPGDHFYVKKWTWSCDPAREVLLYEIGGGGHTWAGHKNWYPQFIVGPAAPAPDATRVIWEFFKAHRRG
jgi:polyhydroxybutyrate depolymerase